MEAVNYKLFMSSNVRNSKQQENLITFNSLSYLFISHPAKNYKNLTHYRAAKISFPEILSISRFEKKISWMKIIKTRVRQ